MKIAATGATGLVGFRIRELLGDHDWTVFSYEDGFDVTDAGAVKKAVESTDADWILHLAAYTDVDGAQKDMELGEASAAWKVNVNGTAHLARACAQTGKKLLYVSTDYVFSGDEGPYDEKSAPDPKGWYGLTKYRGEEEVRAAGGSWVIARIANPYRSAWQGKPDFVHRILDRARAGGALSAPIDMYMVPTFIDDIAHAFPKLMTQDAQGIFHVVGSSVHSSFESVGMILSSYGLGDVAVEQTTAEKFLVGRAPRPLRAHLISGKMMHYGISMHGFASGLERLRLEEKNAFA